MDHNIKASDEIKKVTSDNSPKSEIDVLPLKLTTSNTNGTKGVSCVTSETGGMFSQNSLIKPNMSETKNNSIDTTIILTPTDSKRLCEKRKDIDRLLTTESTSWISEDTTEVKSILVNRGEQIMQRRKSTKGIIQWQDSVKLKLSQQAKIRRTLAAQLLITRGSQMKYIDAIVDAMRVSEELEFIKDSQEDLFVHDQNEMSPLVQDLGTDIISEQESVELTQKQDDKLKELLQEIKIKNDRCFKNHPQLGVLLSLIYSQLFKHLPDEPVPFVADYVHYLNTHREEMILQPDIDVPFDKIQITEAITESVSSNNRKQVTEFARNLVEHCVKISSGGISYFNVMRVVESLINTASPCADDTKASERSIKSATNVVSEILMSLVTSVVETRSTDTELFAGEILAAILDNTCPYVRKDSETYLKILDSVDVFVKSLVMCLFDKATTKSGQKKSSKSII